MSTSNAPNSAPSETTPLLSKPYDDDLARVNSHPIDPSAGLVPGGADPYESDEGDVVAEENGGDLERQLTNGSTAKRHTGMPEVKAKMKYILPAIAIGVSPP